MTDAIAVTGLEAVTVETGLGRVRAFVAGDGVPVVLLHGLSAGASTWVGVVDRLRSAVRVTAVDLPGHGGSSPISFESSSGVRWFAMPFLLRASKKPVGALRAIGLTGRSSVGDGGQRARLPNDSITL